MLSLFLEKTAPSVAWKTALQLVVRKIATGDREVHNAEDRNKCDREARNTGGGENCIVVWSIFYIDGSDKSNTGDGKPISGGEENCITGGGSQSQMMAKTGSLVVGSQFQVVRKSGAKPIPVQQLVPHGSWSLALLPPIEPTHPHPLLLTLFTSRPKIPILHVCISHALISLPFLNQDS